MTEIVTVDIRSALHTIVKNNAKLLWNNAELTPAADMMHFKYYHHNCNTDTVRKSLLLC